MALGNRLAEASKTAGYENAKWLDTKSAPVASSKSLNTKPVVVPSQSKVFLQKTTLVLLQFTPQHLRTSD